jgi:3-dehydroquinate synthetase
MKAIRKDKKFHAGAVRFVLLRSLGDAFVSDSVTEEDLLVAIENLR